MRISLILLYTLYFAIEVCAQDMKYCGTPYLEYINKPVSSMAVAFKGPDISRLSKSTSSIIVPTVVHILYNKDSENISDATILEQIETLNMAFAARDPAVSNIPDEFKHLLADINIQFCIANENEFGEEVIGIIRTHTDNKQIGTDTALFYTKLGGSTAWDSKKYLNIWVANAGEFLAGYAQYPWIGNNIHDGVVMNSRYFGKNDFTNSLGKNLVHETGHYFGLIHIWGDSSGCDLNDGIPDTPPQSGPYFNCPSYPQYSCNSSNMYMNYMDYVSDECMNMFTLGQKTHIWKNIELFRENLQYYSTNTICHKFDDTEINFEIYPNPASNKLFIKAVYLEYKKFDVLLFNTHGSLLFVGNSQLEIDISQLPQAVYFIKIGKIVKRFVKL